MHTWGEEDFDWKGLDEAINFIHNRFRRWRIQVTQSKEKYGTARIYCHLGVYQIHSITHPGYVYSRYPHWLWVLDCRYGRYVVKYLVNWWLYPLHKFIYRDTYKKAVKMYPHLTREILCMADYYELLGGLGYEFNRKTI